MSANTGHPTRQIPGVTARSRLLLLTLLLAASLAATASAAPSVVVNLATLPAGESVTITFTDTIDAGVPAAVESIAVQGSVTATGQTGIVTDDPDTGAGDDPTATPLAAEPDLAVTIDDSGAGGSPGVPLVYEIQHSNVGNQSATGVEITGTIPANTAFDAGSSTPGWAAQGGGIFTLSIGGLAFGGSGSSDFAVIPDSPFPGGIASIEATASIADDGLNGVDPNPSNNSDSDVTFMGQAIISAPASVEFGAHDIDAAPLSRFITVLNTGDIPLVYLGEGASITADPASEFAIGASFTGATVGVGGSGEVEVTFDPVILRARTANLVLTTNDTSQPTVVIPVSGEGFRTTTSLVNLIVGVTSLPPSMESYDVNEDDQLDSADVVRNVNDMSAP